MTNRVNKFLGRFKRPTDYDYRECLVVSYGVPINNEFTEYDWENTLIVDLRSITESVAEYLREVSMTRDAQGHKTFAEFAFTRKYEGKEISILEHLYRSGDTQIVPADCVHITFLAHDGTKFTNSCLEINNMILGQLGSTGAELTPVSNELKEVQRPKPYAERGVHDSTSARVPYGDKERGDGEQTNEKEPTGLIQEVIELREQVAELRSLLLEVRSLQSPTTNVEEEEVEAEVEVDTKVEEAAEEVVKKEKPKDKSKKD